VKVDQRRIGGDPDVDRRMLGAETPEARNEPARRERGQNADRQ